MHGIIYCATNTVSGKQYVGQTTQPLEMRWRHHVKVARNGSPCALHGAIRKYGVAMFKIEQIDFAGTLEELNEKEALYILQLKTLVPSGYNLTTGGGQYEISEETRQKLSKAALGRVLSHETCRRHSTALVGHSVSEKTRKKLSNAAIGRTHSEESRQKMSQAALGHMVSEETRKKISVAQIGKTVSEETRQRQSEAALFRN